MNVNNGAHLSRCRKYRYALWRTWDTALPRVMFVGLNPSTADERANDPTLIRCMNFARDWGYGGVIMANLFAFRATDPALLKRASEPVGRVNNRWLCRLAQEADLVIAAWGNDGDYRGRATRVLAMLGPLHCLKQNRSGQPAHPLYQRADTLPVPLPAL